MHASALVYACICCDAFFSSFFASKGLDNGVSLEMYMVIRLVCFDKRSARAAMAVAVSSCAKSDA
jgi:hypothetical protein